MRLLIVILFVFSSLVSTAQPVNLIAEGTAPNAYITHIVKAKETLYGLARLYNLPPATLAAFNNASLQTGLQIGQTLKVPLNTQNFEVEGNKAGDETLVPVYHVVEKNETLFRLGTNYNAPLPALRQWNGLQGDNIAVGTPMIVGYLKVKSDQAANLGVGHPAIAEKSTPPPPQNKPAAPVSEPVAAAGNNPAPNTTAATGTAPTTNTAATPPPAKDPPATQPKTSASKLSKEAEPEMPVGDRPARTTPASPYSLSKPGGNTAAAPAAEVSDEGFFAGEYGGGAETTTAGDAATFKSTSGWQDKKYYALINNMPAGSIIKITSGGKSIYARVLGSLPDIKENKNLLLRLSNAAASYLGRVEATFPVQVNYFQ